MIRGSVMIVVYDVEINNSILNSYFLYCNMRCIFLFVIHDSILRFFVALNFLRMYDTDTTQQRSHSINSYSITIRLFVAVLI